MSGNAHDYKMRIVVLKGNQAAKPCALTARALDLPRRDTNGSEGAEPGRFLCPAHRKLNVEQQGYKAHKNICGVRSSRQ